MGILHVGSFRARYATTKDRRSPYAAWFSHEALIEGNVIASRARRLSDSPRLSRPKKETYAQLDERNLKPSPLDEIDLKDFGNSLSVL